MTSCKFSNPFLECPVPCGPIQLALVWQEQSLALPGSCCFSLMHLSISVGEMGRRNWPWMLEGMDWPAQAPLTTYGSSFSETENTVPGSCSGTAILSNWGKTVTSDKWQAAASLVYGPHRTSWKQVQSYQHIGLGSEVRWGTAHRSKAYGDSWGSWRKRDCVATEKEGLQERRIILQKSGWRRNWGVCITTEDEDAELNKRPQQWVSEACLCAVLYTQDWDQRMQMGL